MSIFPLRSCSSLGDGSTEFESGKYSLYCSGPLMPPDGMIHQIHWAFATQRAGNLLTGHLLYSQDTCSSVGANVWGTDGIGQREERIIRHWWFWIEDIQCCPCQVSRL